MHRNTDDSLDDTPLETIFDSVGVVIITIDERGIITSANNASTRLFGHSQKDMLGSNVSILMPEPYQSEHDNYINNYQHTGVKKIIDKGRKVVGLRKDGTTFPMHLSVAKHRYQGQSGFTGIVQDLTLLDEAQTATARLGRILDESVNEIYVFDASTLKFSMVNRGAVTNLGYAIEELLEMSPYDIKPYSESEFRDVIKPLLAGDTDRLHFHTVHSRKDGTQYDAEILLQLSDAVEPPEFVAIVQDVTDKNRILDSLHRSQKMESVGNLTGGIAHDFNNLLTVISGNIELLEISIENPGELELLAEAKEAAAMGARLTNRLLSFARRVKLTPTRVDVNSLVLGLTDMLRRSLGEPISLETILSPGLWETTVDISLLENAIVNLALNGRDAMDEGGKLLIETSNFVVDEEQEKVVGLREGNYIKIDVTDNGTGITPDMHQKIFEPFVSTKAEAHGTGLGLSMVYGFTRQSGGDVKLSSEVGVGTTFSVYLPRCQESDIRVEMPDERAERVADADSAARTILVVEDEERVRRLTARRLKKLGYAILEAPDGYAGYEMFQSNPAIDLVFTDIVMTKGMSGYDLAKKIKDINPNVKLLLTSGYAEDLVNAEKLAETGLRLLRKPYTQTELAEALFTEFTAG